MIQHSRGHSLLPQQWLVSHKHETGIFLLSDGNVAWQSGVMAAAEQEGEENHKQYNMRERERERKNEGTSYDYKPTPYIVWW